MKYGTVLFDLDGTLLDTLADLCASVNSFLNRRGFPERTQEQIRSYLGNGAAELLQCALPERVDEETLNGYLQEYKKIYEQNLTANTKPYPGIIELLEHLRDAGIRTAVISNKPDWAVRKLCEENFGTLLDASLGDRAEISRKPDPEPLRIIMAKLGSDPGNTLYVGDSEVDIETAKNAGLAGCAVTWGFRDKEDLLRDRPDHIADTPEQLLEIVASTASTGT